MSEELRDAIIQAIAASGDEQYKRLLLLLLRVEDVFIGRLEDLLAQMTVPAGQHTDDHHWIAEARAVQRGAKSTALRIAYAIAEKGALVAAGVVAAKLYGG